MIDINSLIKNATLSRDRVALNAYKNIKTEIQKNQTAKNAKPLTDELQIQIINRYSKNLEDAVKQFIQARRDDLVSEYMDELEIVRKLLPKPVNKSEIYSFIEDDEEFFGKYWVSEINEFEEIAKKIYIPKKEMGNSIKYLKSKFPTADGKMISEAVKEYVV